MIKPKEVNRQIYNLISDLISCGLANDQNYSNQIGNLSRGACKIGITNADYSIFFIDSPYECLYSELLKNRCFNIKMLDGALITFLYQFEDGQLVKHRLSFFPEPYLKPFQNEPEIYLEDRLYAEIVEKNVVAVPLRFDYDKKAFKPVEHPAAHLTLGQYESCRIPVTSPLTPYQFISFIIDSFYNKIKTKSKFKLTVFPNKFSKTIDQKEESIVHICTPK